MPTYLALISDTHGRQESTVPAIRILEAFEPVAMIHAGDIGGPEMIRLFPSTIPTHFVRGNCDNQIAQLADAVQKQGHRWWGDAGELTLDSIRIAFLHGDDHRRLDQTIISGDYQLVVHGHTHEARAETFGQTLVVNPGAVHRANPHSVAVVDLDSLSVEFLNLA